MLLFLSYLKRSLGHAPPHPTHQTHPPNAFINISCLQAIYVVFPSPGHPHPHPHPHPSSPESYLFSGLSFALMPLRKALLTTLPDLGALLPVGSYDPL